MGTKPFITSTLIIFSEIVHSTQNWMPSDGFAIGMALLWGAKEIPKQPRHISNGISRGIPHNPPQTKNASWIEKSQQCGSTEDGLWKKIRKRAHDFIHSEWREATRERMSQIETRSNDVFGIINDAKRWYDCSAKGRFFGEKQLPFRINRFTLNGHFLSIGQQLRHKYEQEQKNSTKISIHELNAQSTFGVCPAIFCWFNREKNGEMFCYFVPVDAI